MFLPIFVAEYIFSIGKTPPRPNNNTFANAGTSCVVVTNTFTQLVLELINVKHLLASVSQLSVIDSISALNCSHCSRFAGPNSPPTL